jgi:small-conductance mechanosensitive channel
MIGIRETHAAVVAAEIAMKERGIVVETVMIDTKAESGIEKGVVTVGVAALLVALVAVVATVEVARIGT